MVYWKGYDQCECEVCQDAMRIYCVIRLLTEFVWLTISLFRYSLAAGYSYPQQYEAHIF